MISDWVLNFPNDHKAVSPISCFQSLGRVKNGVIDSVLWIDITKHHVWKHKGKICCTVQHLSGGISQLLDLNTEQNGLQKSEIPMETEILGLEWRTAPHSRKMSGWKTYLAHGSFFPSVLSAKKFAELHTQMSWQGVWPPTSSFWFVCLILDELALNQTHALFFVALDHGYRHQAQAVSTLQTCLWQSVW